MTTPLPAVNLRLTSMLAIAIVLWMHTGSSPWAAGEAVAQAGKITHKITGFKALSEIPAAWTIKRFASIAKAKPAPNGQIWYILKGSATNNGGDERAINATTYVIVDSAGNKYKPDVTNTLYQPQGTSITYNKVKPGETKEWLAFFKVPVDAAGLKLLAGNLTFLSKQPARFNLPDPAKYAGAAGSTTPATTTTSNTTKTNAAPATGTAPAAGGRTTRVGPINFSLNKVEVMDRIPASRLHGRWKSMDRATPAPANHTWYYVEGSADNQDKSTRTVMVESVTLVDDQNRVYAAKNDKIMYYVDPAQMLSVVRMKPGASGHWATYIAAPKSASGLRIRVTDLKYKSRNFGYLALSADGPSRPPAAAGNQTVGATTKKTASPVVKTKQARAAPATPKAAVKPAAPVALATITDQKRGFSILVPQKAKVALEMDDNIVYQYRQPPQFYQITVMDNPLESFDGAEKMATANGIKKLKSKTEIENGLMLITEAMGVMQDVWIFKNGASKKMIANCMGSANAFSDLLKMCQSLNVK